MKRSAGFTLIELVIVIIILGILAVTAAPKFLNLQEDANKAAADGVRAAITSSAQLVYSKAVIKNVTSTGDSSESVTLADGNEVTLVYGYPDATANGVAKAVQIDGTWTSAAGTTTGPKTYIYKDANSKCTVTYTEASKTNNIVTAPTAKVSGC